MADEEKGKGDGSGELSEIPDKELQRALQHPVVKHMTAKLDEMRGMVEALPEAIGRAVAEAMRSNQRPSGASGPGMPVVLGGPGGDVAFGRGGQVRLDGKEEAGDPIGIQQLLALVGLDPEKFSIDRITKWTPQQRQKAVAWARSTHLKKSQKGIRVPNRPTFL